MIRGHQRLSRRRPSASLLTEVSRLFNLEAAEQPNIAEKQRLSNIAVDLRRRAHRQWALDILGVP